MTDEFGGVAVENAPPATDEFGGVAVQADEFGGIPVTSTATAPPPSASSIGPGDINPEARKLPDLQATTRGGTPTALPDAGVALRQTGEEILQGIGEVQTHESPIPTPFEIKKDEHPLVAVGKEAVNLAVGIPQFFTTSLGIESVGAAAVAPAVVAAGFTADMLHNLGKKLQDTYKNWSGMTATEKTVAIEDMGATALMAGLTGKATVKGATAFSESYVPRGQGIASPELKILAPLTAQAVEQPKEPNASSQQIATPPDGGVRARSEVGQLPEGNVEAANARLRVNEGEGTSTAQTEAALKEIQAVVQPENVTAGETVKLPPDIEDALKEAERRIDSGDFDGANNALSHAQEGIDSRAGENDSQEKISRLNSWQDELNKVKSKISNKSTSPETQGATTAAEALKPTAQVPEGKTPPPTVAAVPGPVKPAAKPAEAKAKEAEPLKVGDEQTIMQVPSVLADTKTIGGVKWDLFNGAKLKEGRAAVRVIDSDSGEVIQLKQFPTYDAAESYYKSETSKAEQLEKPTPPPTETGKGKVTPISELQSELYDTEHQIGRMAKSVPVGQLTVSESNLPRWNELHAKANDLRRQISSHPETIQANEQAKATAEANLQRSLAEREKRIASLPISQRRNGWEIVKDGVTYVLRNPFDKSDVYSGKLKRVREVADESKPQPPPTPETAAGKEGKVEAVAAQAATEGVPPASVKQPEPISETSPPEKKIDGTAEFAPPATETPPAGNVGPGLGAAKLGEVEVQGNPDIYGVAERVREQRAAAGQVEPVAPGKGIAPADSVERGRELLRSGRSAEQVMSEFERTKQVSADDMAIVRAHGEDLAERARRIEEQFGTDSPEYKTAREFLSEHDRRSKAMQTEWAKIGHAQQGETDIDTGSFTGLARAFKNETGKDFTPKQERAAKKKAETKKKADAEAATAKENLFNALDDAGDIAAAEKRALAAAHKTVRENAIRLADAENKARVAKSAAEKAAADIKVNLARKAAKLAEESARDAAVKLANAENKARVKEASRPEAIQDKAAKDAAAAADKVVRDAASNLADAENKERLAQTKREKALAQLEIKRAKKAVDLANKAKVKAARNAAEAERKLNVARADKARFVWSKAREYIDLGIENFDEIRHKLATDLGMSVEEVTKALAQTKKAKFLTNELWKKQQMVRRIDQQSKQWLRETSLPLCRRAIESVPKILFGLKVGFHGTVALGTHAPMVAFQPRFWKTYVENFGRMYHMVGSKAFYEMKVQDLLRDKNYITARRAGLVNDPFQFEDYNSPDVAKYLDKLTGMGNRGYAVLKMLRQDMFNQHWENLPRALRQREMATAIADAVNHATGVVKVNAPKGANVALFAPRLEMSRVAWLMVDPAIAMKTAIEWKTATRAEKYFAIQQVKEKAWVAGTFFGLLALNQGMLTAMQSKQKVNGIPEFMGGKGFNPMAGDFMKFKVAGMQLSYGNAMLTMARLPVRLYQIRSSDGGKLKNLVHPDEDTYTVLGEYARSQMSPFASLASSLWFKADWQNRPLPSSNRPVPKRLRLQGVEPYTWPEFWTEQVLPIPFEEAAREVWHSGLGMNDQQIAQMRKAMATIAIMGATGARLSDDWTLNEK